MKIEAAKWQPKGAKDRTKSAGAWVCPKCGQRLATVVFDFRSLTRMCGGGGGNYTPEIALVLPSGIDRKKGDYGYCQSPFYFGAGAHFEKTNRHAARQEHGQSEKGQFQALLDESFGNEWAEETLREIARKRAPLAPPHLVAEQLPATFKCSRPGCGVIARIEVMAAPDVLARLQKRDEVRDAVSIFSGRRKGRKLAKDVWFG